MDVILKYFPNLSKDKIEKLEATYDIYENWNAVINLISRKDFQNFHTNHLLHSLSILSFFKFNNGTTFLDVGTGGGFPGIPLAICLDNCNFTLNDSIAKKIKVVEDVALQLSLSNVSCINSRVEQIHQKFDFVTGRAVTALPDFVSLVKDKVSTNNRNELNNGIIYLKGGDFQNEIDLLKHKTKVFDLFQKFPLEFFETKKIVYVKIK